MKQSVLRTLVSVALWAMGHSLLATQRSKALAARALGEQRRNGLYRIGYNAIAVASTVGLVWYVRRLPDRRLYVVRGVSRGVLRGLQLALLGALFAAAIEIGLGPFSGFSGLLAWALRRRAEQAPEAQGPSLGEAGLRTGGPYRFVRHPLNFAATAILFLSPEMTGVRLTVALVTLAYSLLGSKLEERRLLERYGEPYRRYLESGVPFFFPLPRRLAPRHVD